MGSQRVRHNWATFTHSCIADRFFTAEPSGKPISYWLSPFLEKVLKTPYLFPSVKTGVGACAHRSGFTGRELSICSGMAGGVQEECGQGEASVDAGTGLAERLEKTGFKAGRNRLQSWTQWMDPAGGPAGVLLPSGLDLNLFNLR